ncbi:MAG: hypothetical protein AABZ60_13300 [Planctomycetota bacterium]
MKKIKRILLRLIGFIALIYIVVACVKIGPYNLWGMLLYDQRREGDLKVGDQAPDVVLLALDGKTKIHLKDYLGKKPLILIFGSYT